jgi:hypothetical protein
VHLFTIRLMKQLAGNPYGDPREGLPFSHTEYCTLPVRVLDFCIPRYFSGNELGRRVVAVKRWLGQHALR